MGERGSTWSRPQLVAIARSKPEEAVLIVCKGAPGGNGPSANDGGCLVPGTCAVCEATGGS